MLRAASVGLGWWSDELATAIQGKSEAIRIVSCFSRSADKRAAFAQKFTARTHDSFDALLADPEIDAVILTTPHSLHGEHVRQVAAAGKHVFVEKPFALDADDAHAALDACKQAGVTLAIGHNRRFAPAVLRLREMLEADEFGTVLHAEANFSGSGALRYAPGYWRANRAESPGGAIAALGIHMIDSLTWLLGPVLRVTAQAGRRAVAVDIDDTTSALFTFARGPTGYLGTLFACPYTSTLHIFGSLANAFAGVDGNTLIVHRAGGSPEPVALAPVDTLRAELEEFAAACRGEAAFRVRPEEALHDVEVMQAMVASAATGGRPVSLAAAESPLQT